MATKQEIIDALTPGVTNTSARFLQIKRADLAVLCDIDLDAVAPPEAVDEELAALRTKKADLEKAKLKADIAALEADDTTPEKTDAKPAKK